MSATNKNKSKIRIYHNENRFDVGIFEALTALVEELVSFRSHIRTIFMGQFRAAYNGTVLGVFWNFVLPAVPISVYILLVYLRVLPSRDGIAPAVYIGFNVTLWYLITGFIRQPINIVTSRNAEAMKTALPLSASIISSFAQLLFDSLVRVGVVCILIVAFTQWPTPFAPAVVFVVLAGISFCLGVGLILSILNTVFPDVERVTRIVLQYGIFLSGVIFPLSSMNGLHFLEYANPFNVFIHAARDIVFFGTISYPVTFGIWTLVGLILMVSGARFFYVMEYRLRDLA